jgi:hypothetical protein
MRSSPSSPDRLRRTMSSFVDRAAGRAGDGLRGSRLYIGVRGGNVRRLRRADELAELPDHRSWQRHLPCRRASPPMGQGEITRRSAYRNRPPAMYLTHRRAGFDTRDDAVDHILISEGDFGTEPGC